MTSFKPIYVNTEKRPELFRNLINFIRVSGRSHHLTSSLDGVGAASNNIGCLAIRSGPVSVDGSGIGYWGRISTGAKEVSSFEFVTALETLPRKGEETIVSLPSDFSVTVTKGGVKFNRAVSALSASEFTKIAEGVAFLNGRGA